MEGNSTSEAMKLTTSTNPSAASSTKRKPKATTASRLADIVKDAGAAAVQARLAGWITKLRGYGETMVAIADYCEEKGLPAFLLNDDPNKPNLGQYKLTLGKLGGVPLSFPLRVFLMGEQGEETELDTQFRIRR